MTEEETAEALAEIQRLTKLIDNIQGNFDKGEFKGYEAAGELQKARRDRQVAVNNLNLSESNVFAIVPPKPFKLKRSKLLAEKAEQTDG